MLFSQIGTIWIYIEIEKSAFIISFLIDCDRIVGRSDDELIVNDTFNPPVHALWEGGVAGTEGSSKHSEFIVLEESGRSSGQSGISFRLFFEDITNVPYQKVRWYNQSLPDKRAHHFKICRVGGSC